MQQVLFLLGVILAPLLWYVVVRLCMRLEGVTPRFRFAVPLFVTGVVVMLGVVAAAGTFWYVSGTFHPVWAILAIMGLMPLEGLKAIRRDLRTRPA